MPYEKLKDPLESFHSYFQKTKINENTYFYKWDLNKVPRGYNQILLLADLIKYEKNNGYHIKIKPDKRKRAQGLPVLFINKFLLPNDII
jgi:hypothetical protein